MILSINQPAYIPWLGYFDRIASSDVHIVLDHVQFEKNSMVNRNVVLGNQNDPVMLTIPVLTSGKFNRLAIQNIEIDRQQHWRQKHWRGLQQYYRKAPYFDAHYDFLNELYAQEWLLLNDLLTAMQHYFISDLGISTPIKYSSALKIGGTKSELILNLCKSMGADIYLSGPFGRDYLDLAAFEKAKVKIMYHDYRHPEYRQLKQGFAPYLSILDLMFNHGKNALNILTNRDDG